MKMLFDPQRSREESWHAVAAAGYRTNADLPFLDEPGEVRSAEDVAHRILCLHAVIASSFGFKKANEWIDQEGLRPYLTGVEADFLRGDIRLMFTMQARVNGLYALAWSAKLIDAFDCLHRIPDNLIRVFPELLRMESAETFRKRVSLRPTPALLSACDSAYCFHWALRDAELNDTLQKGHSPLIVEERRRALAWVLAPDEDWETVPLDT